MILFRRFKFVYWINNLIQRKKLNCNEDIYKKYGIKKSVVSLIQSKDLPPTTENEKPWLDKFNSSTEDLVTNIDFKKFSNDIQLELLSWTKNGFLKLNNFYSSQECDEINDEIEKLLKTQTAKQRLDERVIFAIHQSKAIYEIANNKKLNDVLSFILGKKVKLFQSLNFKKGSAQLAHSDTIHMTTYPLGYMIAAWIALEDIKMDSGPLFYYPGSHKLPYVLNKDFHHEDSFFIHGKNTYKKYEQAIQDIIEKNNLQKEIFLAKKGDVLIWHANLLHGGMPIENKELTRKSMVLHFYAEDVISYHEITQRPAIFGGKEAECAVTASER
ncbi:MAG: phytanoyl-CoA dioxygenase family protein [Chitinophagaceae bacterium]|nr:phytanoyl-CoA dioxygenase family protein [Chitinophagaceae bacterium]